MVQEGSHKQRASEEKNSKRFLDAPKAFVEGGSSSEFAKKRVDAFQTKKEYSKEMMTLKLAEDFQGQVSWTRKGRR